MRRCSIHRWVAGWVLVLCSTAVLAESARGLVQRGNRAYRAGQYDEALKAYEQADVESPESPVVAFNQGTVKYRAEDYAAAREAFAKAAKGSRDPRFEARCRYNLGNCWFREVRRQMDSDLAKAIEACERSVDEYQAALTLDPELEAARRNIEVVRRLWKSILDEQKRRQEEQKAQQEQQQKLADQLKQLIARQDQAASQSADLAQQQSGQGTTTEVQQQSAAQAASQNQLGQDTQTFADTLQQMASQAPQAAPGSPQTAPGASPAPPPPPQAAPPQLPAMPHLEAARQAQDQATRKLERTQPGAATEDQKQAAEALRKALESMSQKQEGQPGGQEQQQAQEEKQEQEQGKEQGKEQAKEQEQGKEQEQEQGKGEEEGKAEGEKQEQQQAAPAGGDASQDAKERQQARARLADEDARDILDTEKRNRERRTAGEQRGLTPVDKDW